jgi:hypothetical protein
MDYPWAMRFAQLANERAHIELQNWVGPADAKRELRTQAKLFRIAFGKLGQQLTPIWQLMTASERRQLDFTIAALMSSSHSIGEYVQVSPERIELDATNQARAARQARAQTPKERALIRAIVAVRGDDPAERSWKEADRIRKEVNDRLAAAGHGRVKADVIYRRLLKFNASQHAKIPRS